MPYRAPRHGVLPQAMAKLDTNIPPQRVWALMAEHGFVPHFGVASARDCEHHGVHIYAPCVASGGRN